MQIGGIIRAQMSRKKLHQKDLASKLNVDQRTISNYCTNKSFPDLETLSALCNILEIDMMFILEIHHHNNEHLLVQNEKEMCMLDAFRSLSEEKQKAFMDSFLTLASLIKD